jgi:hypothetical protein
VKAVNRKCNQATFVARDMKRRVVGTRSEAQDSTRPKHPQRKKSQLTFEFALEAVENDLFELKQDLISMVVRKT